MILNEPWKAPGERRLRRARWRLRPVRWLPVATAAVILAACMPVRLPAADAAARAAAEAEYAAYWQELYLAHLAGVEYDGPPLLGAPLAPAQQPALPPAVQEAIAFYFRAVEQPDWGSVRLHRMAVPGSATAIWAVRTQTDGDDGWLELYDAQGRLLGAARSYIELLAWGPRAQLRGQVATGAYPPALDDRAARTLWQPAER